MASRDHSKAAFWRRIIAGQAGSGASVRAWCGRHNVSVASFYWWRRRLEGSGRPRPKSGPRETSGPQFVPVRIAADHVDAASGRAGCIEIILSGHPRVRVLGAVDRQALADVLGVLQRWHDDGRGAAEPRAAAAAETAGC